MQEKEALIPNGSFYCVICRKPAQIDSVAKENDFHVLNGSCGHESLLQVNGPVVFLTHEEQKALAEVFLKTLIEGLEDKEILVVNVKNAMNEHTGLNSDECYEIIKRGIEEGWVIETQKLILDKIAKGDLKTNLSIQ